MKTKHIYIDESGHPKNTVNFIICLIIFENKNDQDLTDKIINKFKINKFKTINRELHSNRESLTTKTEFFKKLNLCKFTTRYYKANIQNNTWSNEDCIINSIIEHKDIINDSFIYIDGNMSKHYKKIIISKIRNSLNKNFIYPESIKYTDSKNSNLIRLADMFAGCIRRKIERGTNEDKRLFKLIEKFITYPD